MSIKLNVCKGIEMTRIAKSLFDEGYNCNQVQESLGQELSTQKCESENGGNENGTIQ